jgi:hypothetical protein
VSVRRPRLDQAPAREGPARRRVPWMRRQARPCSCRASRKRLCSSSVHFSRCFVIVYGFRAWSGKAWNGSERFSEHAGRHGFRGDAARRDSAPIRGVETMEKGAEGGRPLPYLGHVLLAGQIHVAGIEGILAVIDGDGDLVGCHLMFLRKQQGETSNDQVPRTPPELNRRRETILCSPHTPRKQDGKISELPPNRPSPVATTATGRLGATRRKYRGSRRPVRALVADADGASAERRRGGRGGER